MMMAYNFFDAVTLFPGAAPVEAGKQPGKVPVNPGLVTVYPGKAPAEPRLTPIMPSGSPSESRQRPGIAPIYHNSTGTHRGYTGIRRPGLTPIVAGNAQAEPR
ncbi:hypothetical protein DPMN_152607 [Dreissena polymorpha]|uniref:Uncharacterized protein n=1 Tax=Dreissena polymorpha TaxID=45954 RepID=A0A9D4FKQ2_DREPO|nr:hypothetical protein DPMN_152607 [Dreissena polymorpha]